MGLLTPLYVAGLAAIALPVLWHLIRRTPRGKQTFSSLMFLSPSPPRVSRRSRLDQLLLLLLRCLALGLLALAFARPFWHRAADLLLEDPPGRRIAILVDVSGSMRRDALWPRTVAAVEQFLERLDVTDDAALFAFDDRLQTVIDWGEEHPTTGPQQAALIRARLAELRPGWGGTDLGAALIGLGDRLDTRSDTDTALQIVLFTDQQRGAQTAALQAFEWPSAVQVAVRRIEPGRPTNAAPLLLADVESGEDANRPRVRVTNALNSASDQFRIAWSNGSSASQDSTAVAAYVPAGQTRVVRLPESAVAAGADRLILAGDDADFDNTVYVVPERREKATVLYLGRDPATDPQGLRYYLETALATSVRRDIEIIGCDPGQPLPLAAATGAPQLVVVTEPLTDEQAQQLRDYLQAAGTVLAVPADPRSLATLSTIVGGLQAEPGEPTPQAAGDDAYVMLGEIDFSHPLFATFASSRYNDFTKIHFWRFRRMVLTADSKARVLARFDNGAPAVCEQTHGRGRVIVLASGWNPADSQLALSTKFVPFLEAILVGSGDGQTQPPNYVVNQSVLIPVSRRPPPGDSQAGPTALKIVKPDGSVVELAAGSESFQGTDQPGIYRVDGGSRPYEFVVNVSPAESDTVPADVDVLEQLGVKIGEQPGRAEQLARKRQERDRELESHQKLWRLLLLVVLGILAAETWLAGRRSRQALAQSPAS